MSVLSAACANRRPYRGVSTADARRQTACFEADDGRDEDILVLRLMRLGRSDKGLCLSGLVHTT
eukprot:1160205-Pelagomonas_calceolata.AAC.6